jgi:hypothetical protein
MTEAAQALFAGGWFLDVVLALMLVEGIVLVAYRRLTGRGIAPIAVVANLAAGGGLLLAFRAAVGGWGAPAIAACMALSFAAHLTDLQRRWGGS